MQLKEFCYHWKRVYVILPDIVVYLISAKKILPDTFDELFFPTLSNISVIQLVVDFGHCTNLASFRKSLQGEQV